MHVFIEQVEVWFCVEVYSDFKWPSVVSGILAAWCMLNAIEDEIITGRILDLVLLVHVRQFPSC